MGCKQSDLRDDGTSVNPEHLPPVPRDCWYAQPFTETSPMPQTEFHSSHKGHVIFSPTCIPTRAIELKALPDNAPKTQNVFVVGEDTIYAMGYLHNTALFIEHHWRTRVAHNPPKNKFERPFYDCLIGVKLFINDMLIPDTSPHAESLSQCTATYEAPEATTVWRAVPAVLIGDPTHFTVAQVKVFSALSVSFLTALQTLDEGSHTLRMEVCYGCKSEADFCTDFISRGVCELIVTPSSKAEVDRHLNIMEKRLAEISAGVPRVLPTRAGERCVYCRYPLKYICTTCGANICGQASCVWNAFVGYPFACQSHGTVTD